MDHIHVPQYQRCGSCKETKAVEEFHKPSRGRSGAWCATCFNSYKRTGQRPTAPNPSVKCTWCDAEFVPRTYKPDGNHYCSDPCRRNAISARKIASADGPRIDQVTCRDCGAEFSVAAWRGRPRKRCDACNREQGRVKAQRWRERKKAKGELVFDHVGRNAYYAANRDKIKIQNRARKYGVTVEWIIEHEASGCSICGRKKPEHGKGWSIDHDHVTQQVRGILCGYCNVGIGSLQDDPEIIAKALKYVTKHRQMVLKV